MNDCVNYINGLNISDDEKARLLQCINAPSDSGVNVPEVPNEGPRDNEDPDKPDDGGIPEYTYREGEKLLYYPEAIRYGDKMRTRGRYKHRYPQGAIVHFTAGRGRRKAEGGSQARDTHREMGEKSVDYAISRGSYCYFVIDRDGNVHQAFSLDRWGYHAGTSKWPGISGTVSDELVGIEIQAAGRLKSAGDGKYKAYFTNTRKGDKYFQEDEVRHADQHNENIQKGVYHKYTLQQERALTELLLWLKRNNPGVFNFDFVAGHDEVNPRGKNDPGAALSMTMPAFRDHIKQQYQERYSDGGVVITPIVERPVVSFEDLVAVYKKTEIDFPKLKAITIAQWMLETGRGTSKLFKKHLNAGGMKWRGKLDVANAHPVSYKAHDGLDMYAAFNSYRDFIAYYWNFLERSYYRGWRDHANDPERFIHFIADAGYCPSRGYAENVIKLLPEAERMLI